MQPNYFEHYSLLVASIHILLSESISSSELRMAGALLNHFYAEYQTMYGMNFLCAMNLM